MTRRIGSRYTVSRVIGRGTCGTVWSGQGPEGPVAIKLLHEDLTADQTLIARFVQERTVLTSLRHPRIVGVRDLVVDGSDLALVMDLLPGPDLRGKLDREGPLPPAEAVALCADIAEALAAAHERGVVHRDVKPENVLLDGTGRGRLTDFGIARLVDGPGRTRATRVVGTPDYLAPEVIEGCPPNPAVDVYALATVLFELLTGWTPFGGGHPGAVLRRHVTESVPRVAAMPSQLAELLDRCLAKSPAVRLSAAEFVVALRSVAPSLAGMPALQVPSPRGDRVQDADVMAQAGAVPLVQSNADPLLDDDRSTHVNAMRPIKEPEPHEQTGAHAARKRGGGRWLLPLIGVGLILVSVLAYLLSSGGTTSLTGATTSATSSRSASAGAGSSSNTPTPAGTGLTALPEPGDFGFTAYAKLPALWAHIVGAVQLAYFDGFLYAAATGGDGNVRVASVPAGASAPVSWMIVPGVKTAVQPALVGSPGALELYVTTPVGLVQRAVLGTPSGGWSPWTSLGTQLVAGAPAATSYQGHTIVVASAKPQRHLVTGTVAANGTFGGWRLVPTGFEILPQLAVAAHGSDIAVYCVRATDGATMRVYDWQSPWPTGAAGQPATAYAADGKPDLFVLSASAGVQVFEFSGADLHGTMNWVSAGVNTINQPGVTSVPTGGVALAAVGGDGSVDVYTTSR